VGDIEKPPFLEAARQFKLEPGRTSYIPFDIIPYVKVADEIKD